MTHLPLDTGDGKPEPDYEDYDAREDLTEEDEAYEDCGRWNNGRLGPCRLAGTEQCDWVCPLNKPRQRKLRAAPLLELANPPPALPGETM
jgi:hypothetical protein